jgi:hypothetical protein
MAKTLIIAEAVENHIDIAADAKPFLSNSKP